MADVKHIIRVANTDLDGKKQIYLALQKVKGVDFMFANALCKVAGIERERKAGTLSDKEEKRINEIIESPEPHGIPKWLLNRRRDPKSGEYRHLFGGEIDFVVDKDIKREKEIKSYRGVRHMFDLPVRGQKTKSNFRPNKGEFVAKKKQIEKVDED